LKCIKANVSSMEIGQKAKTLSSSLEQVFGRRNPPAFHPHSYSNWISEHKDYHFKVAAHQAVHLIHLSTSVVVDV
jgi:hypothetical protein